jgi:hypothetical protein
VGQFENIRHFDSGCIPADEWHTSIHDRQSIACWLGSSSSHPQKPDVRLADAPWRPPIMAAGAPSFQYFNVAIAAPDKAIEATAKHLASSPEAETWEISVVRKLSPAEMVALSLEAGEVEPA